MLPAGYLSSDNESNSKIKKSINKDVSFNFKN
jgi:hypothetical protein